MVRLAAVNNPAQNSVQAPSGTERSKDFNELRFNLGHTLQSSLNTQVIIEHFYSFINEVVRVDGLRFVNEESHLAVSIGKESLHTVNYHISSEQDDLGDMVFYRSKHFGETELAVLEMLIGILFYPLKNSLDYRNALAKSMRDPLTGVANRAALDVDFEREIKLAQRHEQALSVLLIDVDHFKRINDNFGHLSGDQTLKQIALALKDTLRETDQVYRFGGEEFVALLGNTGIEDARQIAERIRVNVAMSPISLEEKDLFCTVSIGIAQLGFETDASDLLHQADIALYQAKRLGRNRVELAPPGLPETAEFN